MKPVKRAHLPRGTPVQKPNHRGVVSVCVLLALAVFAVFGQTLGYEFVNFDDGLYVYQNAVVMKGLTFQGVSYVFTHQMCDFYHPLTMMSLMLDNQVYGLHPIGYHLTNVLLHATTTVLLFLVLRQMMGARTDKSAGTARTQAGALWPSAFVAAVFAIHPLRAESVAWVTERKDVLSGLFFVLTLGAYVRYSRTSFSLVRYLTVIFLFALGLLSKPSLVTLPFLLLLLDYWPLGRMQPAASRSRFKVLFRPIIEKIPLFALSAASSVATILTQQHLLATVGELPLLSRMGYAVVSYVVYLGQMFYPGNLAVLYPFTQKSLLLPEVVLALTLVACISAGVLALQRRCPYLVVGWLWYLGMLVPMIGLVHVGTVARADRFTYLAQIGVCIMVAWAAWDLSVPWRYGRRILGVGALSVIVTLMSCAWKQTSYWRNSESLWTHTLACTVNNAAAYNGLGYAILQKGSVDEAIIYFQKALQINPNYAEAQLNLGIALLQKGSVDEAIAHFQKVLQIDPNFAEGHLNLGYALLEMGRVDEAIAQFQKALQIRPDFAEAHNNLGNALLQKGNVDEAIVHCQKALQINPNIAEAHNNLANALFQKGNVDEAIAHYRQALQIRPDFAEAHNNLGNALLQKGNVDEAIAHYQQALQIRPDFAEALNKLAWVLAICPQASLRNGSKAVELAQRANRLTGDGNPVVLCTLAAAYGEAGRFPEAVETAQRALRLAEIQSNSALADAIRSQLQLYQAGIPFHLH
jgi:tetratricopeptide (TPR) repeat protein